MIEGVPTWLPCRALILLNSVTFDPSHVLRPVFLPTLSRRHGLRLRAHPPSILSREYFSDPSSLHESSWLLPTGVQ